MARGWCSRHYNTWRRTGDPLAPVREYGRTDCSAGDCDRPHFSKGFCHLHYKRMAAHGTPEPRFRAEVRDGKRICARCGIDRPLKEWGAAHWCNPCNAEHAGSYYAPVERVQRACDHCGADFLADGRRSIFCSKGCAEVGRHRRNWKHIARRRTREAFLAVESFHAREIYERDQWKCGLCGGEIDAAARAPDPRSPSIDHIVPVSRGGEHSRANVQAAHLGCNVKKGARLIA